jgi:hypothetical protein
VGLAQKPGPSGLGLLVYVVKARARTIFMANKFFLEMLVKDVDACSFDNWFRTFEKVTFRSRVLPIPDDVLDYLRSDETLVSAIFRMLSRFL